MINILDEVMGDTLGQEHLTPDEIEVEKQDFLRHMSDREKNRLRDIIVAMSKRQCSQRLSLKPHYISKIYTNPNEISYKSYSKVQVFCEFCGQLDHLNYIQSAIWDKVISETKGERE